MSTKVKSPIDVELKAALGPADALWSGIVHVVEEAVSSPDTDWRPSKAEFGRICLLQHKNRTLLYLTPDKEKITIAIVLGDRAYAQRWPVHFLLRLRRCFRRRGHMPKVEGFVLR